MSEIVVSSQGDGQSVEEAYVFELASLSDLEVLQALDVAGWRQMQSSLASIEAFVRNQGTWLLKSRQGGELLASIYTQLVQSIEDLETCSYGTVHEKYSPQGPVLQLLGVQTRPKASDCSKDTSASLHTSATSSGYGSLLLNFVLRRAKQDSSIERVVAVTRCRQYKLVSSRMSIEEYLTEISDGKRRDYGLELHTSRGARIIGPKIDYRPLDYDNLGYGILVCYEKQDIKLEGSALASLREGTESELHYDPEATTAGLRECLVKVIGERRASIITEGIPLMKAGLDSLEVVELQEALGAKFGIDVASTFLFDYPSLRHIVDYLTGKDKASFSRNLGGTKPQQNESIAIVGIDFRFPGGIASFCDFWELVSTSGCTSAKVPFDRWDVDATIAFELREEGRQVKDAVSFGSFLQNIDKFDAAYFKISNNEAMEMDPQHRLLLESVDVALKDSSTPFDKDTGIFVTVSVSDFAKLPGHGPGTSRSIYAATGSATSVAAGRLSYQFGFEGPSMAIDTACSSSLVALNLASFSLKNGECSVAVVGACNLMLAPGLTISYAKAGMLSSDGRCHTFDVSANGYVRGEGCGSLVLKRLSDARAASNKVYAIVLGSAVRQDGISASLTAPNGKSQQSLLKKALENAGVEGHEVSYLEAHGTGTPLGDPIEIGAVAAVYGARRSSSHPLVVGGVKANIGHLEHAAGFAGIVNAILVFQQEQAHPNAQLKSLNPHITFAIEGFALDFPTALRPLSRKISGDPLRAAVSSFGYSGTIAHVVLEKAPEDMARRIELSRKAQDEKATEDVVFLFTGQGSQYMGMGAELYASEEVFRSTIDECDKHIQGIAGYSLVDLLYGALAKDGKVSLDDTEFSQPAIFCVEYALAKLWISKGVVPTGLLGHSIGEFAAACIAGVMTLEDAITLVSWRGRLMQSLPAGEGCMVAVKCTLAAAEKAIVTCKNKEEKTQVWVAAENGSESIVLSGVVPHVDKVLVELKEHRSTRLTVSHAFHSQLMAPILEKFRSEVDKVQLQPAKIAFFSSKTGFLESGEVAKPEYWVEHIADRVRFLDGLKAALSTGHRLFLEVGPRGLLGRLGQPVAIEEGLEDAHWLASMEKGKDAATTFANASRDLFTLRRGKGKRSYPWQEPLHALLQDQMTIGNAQEYRAAMHQRLLDLYQDHVVDGTAIMPGAAYVEMALAGISKLHNVQNGVVLKDLFLIRPMVLSSFDAELRLEIDHTSTAFALKSLCGGKNEVAVHAKGTYEIGQGSSDLSCVTFGEVKARCKRLGDVVQKYKELRAVGLDYGIKFQTLSGIWFGDKEVVGQLKAPSDVSHYLVHPAILDGVFHLYCSMLVEEWSSKEGPKVPVFITRAYFLSRIQESASQTLWAYLRVTKADKDEVISDCILYGSNAEPLLVIEGLRCRSISMDPRKITKAQIIQELWVEKAVEADTVNSAPSDTLFLYEGTLGEMASSLSEVWASSGAKVKTFYEMGYGKPMGKSAYHEVDFEDPGQVLSLLSSRKWGDIVLLFGSGAKGSSQPHVESLKIITNLLKGMFQAGYFHRIVVMTSQGEESQKAGCGLSAIQGLARTARMELAGQGLRLTLIESDVFEDATKLAEQISSELLSSTAEDDVKYVKGIRMVPRMHHYKPVLGPVELELSSRGSLENVKFKPQGEFLEPLGEREVEVKVHSVGLNFRDLLNVLGMYPGDPGMPGNDLAGIVTQMGSQVTSLAIGDEVYGVAMSGCLKTFVRTSFEHLSRIPKGLPFEQASTLPTVLLTVELALGELARLKKGERVLIHSAAGGIGLAALDYAKRVGAEVFATASPEKHAYLKDLGVKNITTSRDPARFSREIREMAGSRGVDVVLNALSGEFIETSIELLAPGGRFMELGKRGVWSKEKMKEVRADVYYELIELDTLALTEPDRYHRMINRLTNLIESGEAKPLPFESFDLRSQALDAFRLLQKGTNKGKVVIQIEDAGRRGANEGTFVITGGLGGVGLLTAEALIARGVRSILLCSRTGRVSYDDQGLGKRLEALQEQKGCEVHVIKCDVSKEDDVVRMLKEARALGHPLRGIFHAAGVLKDGLIVNQEIELLEEVLEAKAKGAFFLHQHTSQDNLEAFVVYSSVVSATGNIGQGSYGAANAYLDGLTRWRRGHGLPAISIQWPAISEVGMAAAMKITASQVLEVSISPADVKLVIQTLDYRAACCVQTVVPPGFLEEDRVPGHMKDVFKGVMIKNEDTDSPTVKIRPTFNGGILKKPEAMKEEVAKVVREEASKIATKALKDNTPLMSAGVTSLDATELANLLSKRFGLKLSSMLLFDYPTIEDLTNHIFEQVSQGSSSEEANSGTLNSTLGSAVSKDDEVGVVGISCRTAGGISNVLSFWHMIMDKGIVLSKVPRGRWNLESISSGIQEEKHRRSIQHGGFLEDIDLFDAAYFGMSEMEAMEVDVQQRLLLETVYESFDDAGYDRDTLKGTDTGVYVGVMAPNHPRTLKDFLSPYAATGFSQSIASGRVSFILGLSGPSMSLDTACSSSVMALHEARRSLQRHETSLAVVAAVNINSPAITVAFAAAGMLSPDGRCFSFDERANGYVRSEAVAAFVLARLVDVRKNGLRSVYGVVRGCAVAQDGTRASLTAPNGKSQQAVLRQALADAVCGAHEVQYLEAHGTGTIVGDAIEMGAVAEVYGNGRERDKPLTVGCVKANIGHAEVSSGLIGLTEAILVLQHGMAPANAQLQSMNPKVKALIGDLPIEFPVAARPLQRPAGKPFLAAFSSFGYSGTIGHVILEEAPEDVARGPAVDSKKSLFTNRKSFPVNMDLPINNDKVQQPSVSTASLLGEIRSGKTTVLDVLKKLWGSIINRPLEAQDDEKSFSEFGASSLQLPKMAYSIKQSLGIELTMRDLLQHNTLKKLESLCTGLLLSSVGQETSPGIEAEDELPPRQDLILRGTEVAYMQNAKRGTGILFAFVMVKNARDILTDNVLQYALGVLQEQNPFLSCTVRPKSFNEWHFAPTTKKIPLFFEDRIKLPSIGGKGITQAMEQLASLETSIAPRWKRYEDPHFCLIKYASEPGSSDLGLCFSVSHAFVDGKIFSWIKDFIGFCADKIAGRSRQVKRYRLPLPIVNIIEWKRVRSANDTAKLSATAAIPATIGTPSRLTYPRKTLGARYVIASSIIDVLNKLGAEKCITSYSYLCAAAVGAFALSYPNGKRNQCSITHSVDLLPATKYHRDHIKYMGSAVGSMGHAVPFVGGDIGDLWNIASFIGADVKRMYEKGEYVDGTQEMIEGGGLYKHKTVDRFIGGWSYFSLSITHLGDIPEIGEGTPFEVDNIYWGMNYNTLGCHITMAMGYTPKGELIINLASNNARMRIDELKQFGSDFESLLVSTARRKNEVSSMSKAG